MPSLKKNYFYNLSYQIISLLLPFITTPYTSRILGADCIGISSFTASIVNYFTLFGTLGIGLYGQREIAYYQNNKTEKSRVFWNLISLRTCTILISLGIYLIIIFSWHKYRLYFLIQTLTLIACLFDVTWVCQGEENFKIVVIRNIFFRLLSVIFLFGFIKSSDDLWKFILMNCGITLFCNFSLFPYVLKKLDRCSVKNLSPFKYLKPVFLLFIPQIAIQIYTVLDKTMIGFITNSPYENGCYEQANKTVKMLLVVVTSLGTVVVPRMANLHAHGDSKTIQQYLYRSFSFVFMVGLPMCTGLSCIASVFVPVFLGSGYDEVIPLLRIFSFLFIAIGLNNVIGVQYLIPVKKEKIFTYTVIAGAVSNLIMNMILIPKYSAVGAAFASVVAESIITIIQFVYIHKMIKLKTIFFQSWKYFLATGVMTVLIVLLKTLLNTNIISLLILVILGIISYAIMLILLRDSLILSVITRFTRREAK